MSSTRVPFAGLTLPCLMTPPCCWADGVTPFGRYVMEVYDPLVLQEYVFRPPSLLLVVIGVMALIAWRTDDAQVRDLDRLNSWISSREKVLVPLLCFLAGAGSWLFCQTVINRTPRITDERTYLFQARTLAAGRLWIPTPPPPLNEAAGVDFTVQNGPRWYGRFPPGWPALLAVGIRSHTQDLINPVLTVIGLFLVFQILRPLLPLSIAILVQFLLATSPFVIPMGGSFMSHPLALVLVCTLFLGYRSALTGRIGGAILWGASTGYLFLTRPPEALVFGVVTGFHMLFHMLWLLLKGGSREQRNQDSLGDRPTLRAAAAALMALIPLIALSFLYNKALTGDPFTLPTLQFAPNDHPGFSPLVGNYEPEGHDPGRAAHNAAYRWAIANEVLFGWPFLSLLPAICGLGIVLHRGASNRGAIRRTTEHTDPAGQNPRFCLGLLLCMISMEVFYFFWYNPGFGYGSRYHYSYIPALAWLTGEGIRGLSRLNPPRSRLVTATSVLLLTVISFTTHFPRRIESHQRYWRIIPPGDLIPSREDPGSLAVVVPRLWVDGVQDIFTSFAGLTTPFPAGSSIFAVREGPGVLEALESYVPDRKIVRLEKDAIRQQFEAVYGPSVELIAQETAPDLSGLETP